MQSADPQRLIAWEPTDFRDKTPSFGDVVICSSTSQRLSITLPFADGDLRIDFNDTRAFMTSWDSDPSPYLTFEEAASRPSDLLKIERSRWLASCFYVDIESSLRTSDAPWEHFCVLSGERSLHIAARDDIEVVWSVSP